VNKDKITIALLSVCSTALFAIAGCATTSDVENLRNNISTIRMETAANKKDIAELKSTLMETSKDVTALKERTEGVVKEYTLNAIREGQASLLTQISDLSRETQTLKGRFDENKYFMDKTIKDLFSERELLQAKIVHLENEIKELKTKLSALSSEKKEMSTPPDNKMESANLESKSAEANDPQKIYDDAHIAFKEKKYADAIQKFEKFTKDFSKHSLASNAYFWLGESYYADKRHEDAILAYETFLKKYPGHEKNKGAMLKQGYSFIEMGDKKTGKVILERVIEKYPNSREAELAEKKIAEILPKGTSQPKKKKR
jgi:tol-pal system protein YbgF